MKLFIQYVVREDYCVPTNCSLTVNDRFASLIAWLDHLCQKTDVGGKQRHAPCRRMLLQQIPMTRKNKQMAPSPRQLLNGQGVRRISGFKSECLGIRFATLNVANHGRLEGKILELKGCTGKQRFSGQPQKNRSNGKRVRKRTIQEQDRSVWNL